MRLSKEALRRYILDGRLRELFIELGWDPPPPPSTSQFEIALSKSRKYRLECVAMKRGAGVFSCTSDEALTLTMTEQRALLNKLEKRCHESMLIISGSTSEGKAFRFMFLHRDGAVQTPRTIDWNERESLEALYDKLAHLHFSLEQESDIRLYDVTLAMLRTFSTNSAEVTRKFYQELKQVLEEFVSHIICPTANIEKKQAYAIVMLNRLMFIYFIQKKDFLSGNRAYLKDKLAAVKNQQKNNPKWGTFYKVFLKTLFNSMRTSLDAPDRNKSGMLGKVPYVNGGLFDIHEFERCNSCIDINDDAFTAIFNLFDSYEWHIDVKQSAGQADINPDVLGYIFEQYINDRSNSGSYYTEEDITKYVSHYTIGPYLLEKILAFDQGSLESLWEDIKTNPDRYIYWTLRTGSLLPKESKRDQSARKSRLLSLKARMKNGRIGTVDDIITHNLNISEAQGQVLSESSRAVICELFCLLAGAKAEWIKGTNIEIRNGLSVLDPSCGSGAFLFAALNILVSIYDRCLERMKFFIANHKGPPDAILRFFQNVIGDVESQVSRDYWIYKTAILENLYGVDIMPEAVEVAKLRLFLKLAGEAKYDPADPNNGLMPLPDIDFNILHGNSLVGCSSLAQLAHEKILYEKERNRIQSRMKSIGKLYEDFKSSQARNNSKKTLDLKSLLMESLTGVNKELDKYTWLEAGKVGLLDDWVEMSKPFHWPTNFYKNMGAGKGFDIIIGNPPFVKYSIKDGKPSTGYMVHGYKTEKAKDLYAFLVEKSLSICASDGRIGLIVPISIASAKRSRCLRALLEEYRLWFSNYAERPAKLFKNADPKLSILLMAGAEGRERTVFSTSYVHWYKEERERLFKNLAYCQTQHIDGRWGKVANQLELSIIDKVGRHKASLASYCKKGEGEEVSVSGGARYYIRAFNCPPPSKRYKVYRTDKKYHSIIPGIVISSLFYFMWRKFSNCRDVEPADIKRFSIDIGEELVAALKGPCEEAIKAIQGTEKIGARGQPEYHPKEAKSEIDRIDRLLGRHYGFTEEETDYIINYDIKYRQGRVKKKTGG